MAADEAYRSLDDTTSGPRPWVRVLTIVCASLACLLAAGLVFGFSAIYGVLVDHGVFHDACGEDAGAAVCPEQALALNKMFTMATSALNMAGVPAGIVLDKVGPKCSAVSGLLTVATGCVIFANGNLLHNNCYYIGFLLMAVGGPSVFTSTISFGNLMPQHSGIITAACVGAFDASSAMLPVLAVIYGHGISFEGIFCGYAAIPILLSMIVYALWPHTPFDHLPEPSSEVSVSSFRQRLYSLDHKPISAQVKSSEFWMTAYAVSACMLALNFFIGTIPEQLQEFSPASAVHLTSVFAAMLPAGGIVWIPLVGYVVDHLGLLKGWVVLWICFLTFSALSFLHAALGMDEVAYVAFAVFSFARPLLYTLAASFSAQMFGMQNFGTCYGLIFSIAGIVNLNVSVFKVLAEKSGSYTTPNLLILMAELLVASLPILLSWHSRPGSQRRPSRVAKLQKSLSLRHSVSYSRPFGANDDVTDI